LEHDKVIKNNGIVFFIISYLSFAGDRQPRSKKLREKSGGIIEKLLLRGGISL